jgi:pilus assembly protein Flp/PilA
MFDLIKKLWKDDSGATAVEYGIMVGLIAVAIVGAVILLGQALNDSFQKVVDELPS